jgi:hypothetical protein
VVAKVISKIKLAKNGIKFVSNNVINPGLPVV